VRLQDLTIQSLVRPTVDLFRQEWKRLRPDSEPEDGWHSETDIRRDGLNADSLERIECATAVSQFFHMDETGVSERLLGKALLGDWAAMVHRSLQRYSQQLTFATSGSTGTAKLCTHQAADLQQEIEFWADYFSGVRRIVALVPSHHIYGFLWTVWLPQALKIPVVDLHQALPSTVKRQLQPGDLVIGHPFVWSALLKVGVDLFGIRGISSTAPLPLLVRHQMAAAGIMQLIEVYGSSETGGVAFRDQGESPYQLLPFWQMCDNGIRSRDRVVTLMDRVEWHGDRHFEVLGRADEAVQVAGHNVFPRRVEQTLRGYPGVLDAAVRLRSQGDRLKALIVAESPIAASELERWARQQLNGLACPASFTIVSELQRNENGKLMDWSER
jgi:long-chain acyl-CoA synthetase